jgi:hypothetical protein
MNPKPMFPTRRQAALAIALGLSASLAQAQGSDTPPSGDALQAIEQTLLAARDAQRGVTLYLQGQTLAGLVLQVQSGQWVLLRSQQFGRIVVRLERIDAVARA